MPSQQEATTADEAAALVAASPSTAASSEMAAFIEWCACVSARHSRPPSKSGMQEWRDDVAEVPAEASARFFLAQNWQTIAAIKDPRARMAIVDRFVFTSVYGKQGGSGDPIPMEEVLKRTLKEREGQLAAALASSSNDAVYTYRPGTFDHRHRTIRAAAFPYTPACAASNGSATMDCVDVASGLLVGYMAYIKADGYVDDLSVLPECQGRGIARQLVGAAAEQLHTNGVTTLSLHVRACNHPATKLYLSLGLRRGEWEFPGWYDEIRASLTLLPHPRSSVDSARNQTRDAGTIGMAASSSRARRARLLRVRKRLKMRRVRSRPQVREMTETTYV